MRTQSLGGAKYFLTSIDDFSRETCVYFLKNKYDVFANFKQFKAVLENESGHRIKVLMSDRGGEYESHAFRDFCYHNGIQR
jgi:transposase InsO family protein